MGGSCRWGRAFLPPYINKWWTFTASLGLALCCGLTYTVAIWSAELKSRFGLSQSELQLVASCANIGGYSGIFAGVLYDALERHKRFGPRIVLLIGCVLNASGYFGLWAALQGWFEARLWQLAALAAISANAGAWIDCTIMASNVRNFPSSRGTVVGLLKAGIGLSGSLFASVYSGVFAPARAPFLLFLGLGPLAVGLLALPFLNTCTFVQVSELERGVHVFTSEGRFLFALQALGTLAVYLIVGATVNSLHPLDAHARAIMTAGAGLLLLPLLLIPSGSGGLLSKKAALTHTLSMYQDGSEDEEEEQEAAWERVASSRLEGGGGGDAEAARARGDAAPLPGSLKQPLLGSMERAANGGASTSRGRAAPGERGPLTLHGSASAASVAQAPFPELSPLQCLRSSSFWLLFAALTISMGSGLALLNNLNQLVKALAGVPHLDTPVLVSLFSVCNCADAHLLHPIACACSRMSLGWLPEHMLHTRGTPRLLFLPYLGALMAAACLGLAYAGMPALYPLAALTGFAFGGHWTLFPSLVSELFGLSRFAANYTLAQLAPALGSLTLAMGLTGWVYDRASARHGAAAEACLGHDCFRPAFQTLACLGLAATACGALLCRSRLGMYRAMHREVHSYDAETHRQDGTPAAVEGSTHGGRRRGSSDPSGQ
ncbi:MFS general substrate transporter isoform B [Micractinium conductrix]|uniref:MFS general substrate transporter isoform B n=1 Tax=Micractinium conductrix TaxID=554055 RepID=A0A2P6VAR1_9CHLO|nr:MFS general substrate transporter isoform B [Micractinium conductrix]|eukprot:PSC71180.1 MFS general substrate transporter isoform B [Micractinium conductrix]